MSGNVSHINRFDGLDDNEISALQEQYGKNSLGKERSLLLEIIWEGVKEPMFILLVIACSIYFILGQANEGIMMAAAIVLVTTISIYQGTRSSKALKALKELTEPKVKVIRSTQEKVILSIELVPGDLMILEEGDKVPADAVIIQENDLSVNESIITGESLPVEKDETIDNNTLFQGTLINSGKCYARVTATGNLTVLGKIGKSIEEYSAPKTPLQQSMTGLVRRLALFGVIAFVLIWLINYFRNGDVFASLLIGLTLAMAAIPEEIPVAFSSFMALGAYRMSRFGIISRQPQIIENVGALSVICLDKTGTITENVMEVRTIYNYRADQLFTPCPEKRSLCYDVLRYAVLASETDPFDEMERGILKAQNSYGSEIGDVLLRMIYEYPLSGTPPMMTHVYESGGERIVTGKGSPERIFSVCRLDKGTIDKLIEIVRSMASKGERVIGIASAKHSGTFPADQDHFDWRFEGLISLFDPPKKNLQPVFRQFKDAGIEVKLITGDFPETALNIAAEVGIPTTNKYLIGSTVMKVNMIELREAVKEYVIFARMFPDAKRKVIEALKLNGEMVAMTGDGVNDAPALKSANVGIAMGKKGTQLARQAADIILTDDNLEKVVTAIRHGRKIFSNLKKAVRYIISIHIPIILTASLPLLFGWKFPNIFTPVHVIFLELIMGPTCSIFFENEPEEKSIMLAPPRKGYIGLFEKNELLISIVQGLAITLGVLGLYFIFMKQDHTVEKTRTMVFATLLASNIFLTFTNRSFTENFFKTIRYRNKLAPLVLIISIFFLLSIHFIPFVRQLFGLTTLSATEILIYLATSFISVVWFELYKTDLKLVFPALGTNSKRGLSKNLE